MFFDSIYLTIFNIYCYVTNIHALSSLKWPTFISSEFPPDLRAVERGAVSLSQVPPHKAELGVSAMAGSCLRFKDTPSGWPIHPFKAVDWRQLAPLPDSGFKLFKSFTWCSLAHPGSRPSDSFEVHRLGSWMTLAQTPLSLICFIY